MHANIYSGFIIWLEQVLLFYPDGKRSSSSEGHLGGDAEPGQIHVPAAGHAVQLPAAHPAAVQGVVIPAVDDGNAPGLVQGQPVPGQPAPAIGVAGQQVPGNHAAAAAAGHHHAQQLALAQRQQNRRDTTVGIHMEAECCPHSFWTPSHAW